MGLDIEEDDLQDMSQGSSECQIWGCSSNILQMPGQTFMQSLIVMAYFVVARFQTIASHITVTHLINGYRVVQGQRSNPESGCAT
jgi:hypothetical protein